eukprot:Lankesteria_metandrocarpae@DN8476_c0_g1_i1.p1
MYSRRPVNALCADYVDRSNSVRKSSCSPERKKDHKKDRRRSGIDGVHQAERKKASNFDVLPVVIPEAENNSRNVVCSSHIKGSTKSIGLGEGSSFRPHGRQNNCALQRGGNDNSSPVRRFQRSNQHSHTKGRQNPQRVITDDRCANKRSETTALAIAPARSLACVSSQNKYTRNLDAHEEEALLAQNMTTLWLGDLERWEDEAYLYGLFEELVPGALVRVKIVREKTTGFPMG